MIKNVLVAVITLFTLFQGQNAQAQCPTYTVDASAVCLNYPTACGCDVSNFTLVNFTPPAGVCAGADLYINGVNSFALSSFGGDPFNGTISSPNSGYQFRLPTINTGATYMVAIHYDNGGFISTCFSQPFTIGVNNTNADPDFYTHWKSLSAVMGGIQGITSYFYANDPITFDATPGADVIDYTLSCTPANSAGTAIGSTVTIGPYYPANFTHAYLDLRASFSGHLVNPTGMTAMVYYLLEEKATGCSGNIITKTKLISINHAARAIKFKVGGPIGPAPMVINVSPNPSTGVVNLLSDSTLENAVITVVNVEGREVFRSEGVESKRMTIDISSEVEGMYFLSVQSDQGLITEKLIKQ